MSSFGFRFPKPGETWDQARERGRREDAELVIRDDGRHHVGSQNDDDRFLYGDEGVITVYECATCYREVEKVDGEGPWVHVNRLIEPEEDDDGGW